MLRFSAGRETRDRRGPPSVRVLNDLSRRALRVAGLLFLPQTSVGMIAPAIVDPVALEDGTGQVVPVTFL